MSKFAQPMPNLTDLQKQEHIEWLEVEIMDLERHIFLLKELDEAMTAKSHEKKLIRLRTALAALKDGSRNAYSFEQVDKLRTFIGSEIADSFAGHDAPGEPSTTEQMQSQLISRIESVFAHWLKSE